MLTTAGLSSRARRTQPSLTGAGGAVQHELAPVRDDDRPRDGEPEPGPVGNFLAPGLEAHERLEDTLDVGGRDAAPGIAHGDGGPVALAGERDLDLGPGRRVL